ncbi:MAG: pyridoxal-phosphate dependent enzyme [Bdellovibrionales bacterium]
MSQIYDNILEMVGHTPMLKLNRVVPSGSKHNYYGKAEFINPAGSIKDRIALAIIDEAEKRGELKPGATIIEATSGNTGVGLGFVAAVKGYKSIFVMPSKMSKEKVDTLRAYGAKVILTPVGVEPDDPRSHYSVAKKLVEITPNSFYANQFFNPDNPDMHYKTTGPEIWEQMGGKVDVLVSGAGTGGTISGVGKYLKEKNPDLKVVLVDPPGSILHDMFHHGKVVTPPAPYQVEGIGEDMVPGNIHFNVIDDAVYVEDKDSFMMARDLLKKEGVYVGGSAGTNVAGAIQWAEKVTDKSLNVVTFLCDSGNRYLSKQFNDDWMKEYGFIDSPMRNNTVADLIRAGHGGKDLISVGSDATVMKAIETFKEHRISQIPVLDGESVVGLVDETDLLFPLASGEIKPTDAIINFVKENIIFIDKEEPLQKLADLFQDGYVALVYDDSKNLCVVTKIDLIDFLSSN